MKNGSSANVIEYENQRFGVIYKSDSVNVERLLVYDALIVEAGDADFTAMVVL